jgi:hypothetical protein
MYNKKLSQFSQRFFLLLLVIASAILLASCAENREKGMKPSPDWSRGVELGSSVSGSASAVVEGPADKIHLVWLASDSRQSNIRYLQLDGSGSPAADQVIQLPPGQLRMPRLLPAADGLLHLLWASRENSAEKWTLWYVQLDQLGETAGQAQRISTPDLNVSSYTAVQRSDLSLAVFWAASFDNGLYAVEISPTGKPEPQQVQIAGQGSSPNAKVDSNGDVHLSWVDERTFFYARFAGGKLQPVSGIRVAEVTLTTADGLSGPVLGLSDRWVYLIWSVERQTGLEAGTARSEYISFPIDQPGKSVSQTVWIYPAEEQSYQPHQGDYNLTLLAEPAGPGTTSDYIYQPAVAGGQRRQLAAAVAVRQEYRQEAHVQIATLIFEDGQFKGYQLSSKTKALSYDPVLVPDEAGALHLLWRQGAMGRDIYYATTSPALRVELDRLTASDAIDLILTGGMESLVGILFFPWIGIGWLLPGLALVGIHKLVKDNDSISRSLLARLLLGIAILVYQGTKLLILPTITFYVPFSAWIEIPGSWRMPLQIGVPLAILALASLATWLVRHKRTDSAVMLYLVFVAVDALFTLAIYGVGFLGVY